MIEYITTSKLSAEEDKAHKNMWDTQDFEYFGEDLTTRYGSQNNSSFYVVAREDEKIIGFGRMKITNGVGFVDSVILDKPARGKGAGRYIFEALIEEAKKQGLFYVWLETREEWTEAVSLYKSCGFETTQYLPMYYFGKPWIIMSKTLTQ